MVIFAFEKARIATGPSNIPSSILIVPPIAASAAELAVPVNVPPVMVISPLCWCSAQLLLSLSDMDRAFDAYDAALIINNRDGALNFAASLAVLYRQRNALRDPQGDC